MAGQIVNISNDEVISEVSLKCGDIYFKDFPKNIYSQSVYRAERSIAKEFNIMDRVWSYANAAGPDSSSVLYASFTIAPLNYNGSWRVTVTPNGGSAQEYEQRTYDEVVDNIDSSKYYYAIVYNANERVLYYTTAAVDDVIGIWYTSSIAGAEDYESTDSNGDPNAIPALPNKFYEEIIRRAVRYMAQLGIATFDQDKGKKYVRILRIYTRRDDEGKEIGLERDRQFIKIKAFQYP